MSIQVIIELKLYSNTNFRILKASYKLQGFIFSFKSTPFCMTGFHLLQAKYKPSSIRHFNSHLIRLRHYTHEILFNEFQLSIFSKWYSCSTQITCLQTINKISSFYVMRKNTKLSEPKTKDLILNVPFPTHWK